MIGSPARATLPALRVDYGREIERDLAELERLVCSHVELSKWGSSRWLAIKLLEGDTGISSRVRATDGTRAILDAADDMGERLERLFGDDVDTLIADMRYGWINGLVREAVKRPPLDRHTVSDRIDSLVTNRVLGLPIFLVAMWAVFKLTTTVSEPYLGWIEGVFSGPLTHWALRLVDELGVGDTWVSGLLIDGVIAGVGGVLVFVPVLMSLYLALSVLEDSGYMARAAFVMDRLMRTIGLHGKSFLPMLVGFGCSVPAIYATRTLEDERDRVLTGLLVPFMSCGARLPVYVLFAAMFFPGNPGTVVFGMYLVGIAIAALLAVLLRRSIFSVEEQAPFVMELPPYRLPTVRGIVTHMWERTSEFVRKAWTIILLVSVVLWLLMAVPMGGGAFGDTDVDTSLFASVSGALAPVFAPLGFGSWQSTGSLVAGFVAKEVVVSTLAQVHGVGEDPVTPQVAMPSVLDDLVEIFTSFVSATIDTLLAIPSVFGVHLVKEESVEPSTELMARLRADFERTSGGHAALAGLSFMIFVLLYTPCAAAVAAERHELGGHWALASMIGQFVLSWVVAGLVFQGGLVILGS